MVYAMLHDLWPLWLLLWLFVLLCSMAWFPKSILSGRLKWTIAIISNAVILLPGVSGLWIEMGHSREKANALICLANMKILANAMIMYTQDWDGKFPPAGRWGNIVYPQVKQHNSLPRKHHSCPSAASPYTYAMNLKVAQSNSYLMPKLAQTVMIFESDAQSRNAFGGMKILPQVIRHLGGENYGFADGHVKWVRRDRAIVGKDPNNPDISWQP